MWEVAVKQLPRRRRLLAEVQPASQGLSRVRTAPRETGQVLLGCTMTTTTTTTITTRGVAATTTKLKTATTKVPRKVPSLRRRQRRQRRARARLSRVRTGRSAPRWCPQGMRGQRWWTVPAKPTASAPCQCQTGSALPPAWGRPPPLLLQLLPQLLMQLLLQLLLGSNHPPPRHCHRRPPLTPRCRSGSRSQRQSWQVVGSRQTSMPCLRSGGHGRANT
mmetsp:Transcript_14431/g.28826  ORF Transcript_14431/g.28826 Transcript_14431/m.28826 type:complete len:219 (-) Transcript_14431:429-1085(-)